VSPYEPEGTTTTTAEIVNEASAWAAGGGILTTALAPLAIPILALTIVAVLPLLLLPLIPVLVLALVALPFWVVARLVRRLRRRRPLGQPARFGHTGPGSRMA
jgi:nitrate/nitrite transporter NarK